MIRRKAWQKKSTSYDRPWIPRQDVILEFLEADRRAFEGGNWGAVRDALSRCHEHRLPLPRWLWEAADRALLIGFDGKLDLKRWLRKYRADMIDFARYDAVVEARQHGRKWGDEVYYTASELLEGTPAAGTEDGIEKSYKRCKNRMKKEPARYYVLRLFRLPTEKIVCPRLAAKRTAKRARKVG